METTDPAKALTLIMEANGWSQRQLGRELGGRSQGWVSSVLVGRRDPGIRRYAAYLGNVGWEVVIRPKREDQVKRREFHENIMKVAGGALAGKTAGVFVGPMNTDSPYQDPNYVLGLAHRASAMREEIGGVPLVQKIWGQAGGIDAALSQGGSALSVAASEFSRQAAWVFHDAGRPDLAERLAGKALTLARKSNDLERQAAAHATMSDILLERNNPDRAAFHAQAGLNLPEVSDGFRAPLKAYMAWAMGQKTSAGVPKSRSHRLIDQALDASGISSLDSAWVQHAAGVVFHNLGEAQQALSAFEQSARLAEPEQEAHALADATRVALATRELDHAAQLMGALSYLAPLVTSTRIDRKIMSVLRESAPWSNAGDIRQARELLLAVVREAKSSNPQT